MSDKEKIWYSVDGKKFLAINLADKLSLLVDEYNDLVKKSEVNENDVRSVIEDIIMLTRGQECPHEFSQMMIILMLAIVKGKIFGGEWLDGAHIAMNRGDLEICRELVIDSINSLGVSIVKNSHKDFLLLTKENKEQNVEDIFRMIMDELNEFYDVDESIYLELLEAFAELLAYWRNIEVPKTQDDEGYAVIYEIVELCYKYKAYHTAVRLSGLLYISDKTEFLEYLSNIMYLMGKVAFELGYMEVAKRCFIFANEDTEGTCWRDGDEKYEAVLKQEAKLEMTDEIFSIQSQRDENVHNGRIKLYTREDIKRYRDGEIDLEFMDLKKQKKGRKRLGEKAIKKYEKYAQGGLEERKKGIEEAFSVLSEEYEAYEEAAYLYYLKANIYMDENDLEAAYDCFKKAYHCENGKRNGMVLLGIAIVLSKMGKINEATAYLFRTYILCGKDFIIDKVGKKSWEMLEQYLRGFE